MSLHLNLKNKEVGSREQFPNRSCKPNRLHAVVGNHVASSHSPHARIRGCSPLSNFVQEGGNQNERPSMRRAWRGTEATERAAGRQRNSRIRGQGRKLSIAV